MPSQRKNAVTLASRVTIIWSGVARVTRRSTLLWAFALVLGVPVALGAQEDVIQAIRQRYQDIERERTQYAVRGIALENESGEVYDTARVHTSGGEVRYVRTSWGSEDSFSIGQLYFWRGDLIFALVTTNTVRNEERELRYYFDGGKLVRALLSENGRPLQAGDWVFAAGNRIQAEARKLARIAAASEGDAQPTRTDRSASESGAVENVGVESDEIVADPPSRESSSFLIVGVIIGVVAAVVVMRELQSNRDARETDYARAAARRRRLHSPHSRNAEPSNLGTSGAPPPEREASTSTGARAEPAAAAAAMGTAPDASDGEAPQAARRAPSTRLSDEAPPAAAVGGCAFLLALAVIGTLAVRALFPSDTSRAERAIAAQFDASGVDCTRLGDIVGVKQWSCRARWMGTDGVHFWANLFENGHLNVGMGDP